MPCDAFIGGDVSSGEHPAGGVELVEVIEPRKPFQQEKIDAGSKEHHTLQIAEMSCDEHRKDSSSHAGQDAGKRLERQSRGEKAGIGRLHRTVKTRAEAKRG